MWELQVECLPTEIPEKITIQMNGLRLTADLLKGQKPLVGQYWTDYLNQMEPFFQLGMFGVTVPALKLDGEVGQQIGYLNAAMVGTAGFVALLLVGWAFAHKDRVREIMARRRRKG